MNSTPATGFGHEPIATPCEDLCLDYANTRFWRGTAVPTESLSGFSDLLDWLGGHAGLPSEVAGRFRGWVSREGDRAAALFAEAIALRELIYRSFAMVASGDVVPDDDLAALNASLADALPRDRLVRWNDGYAWSVERGAVSTPALLAPVLWSAADLLTRVEQRRVRRCANDQCRWLFIDHSKGGTRRWCDMAACGNRAKSQRHYHRTRAALHRPR